MWWLWWWPSKNLEEPKITSKMITFESKFKVDFSKLQPLQQDQSLNLPTVALVHNGSCFRFTDTIRFLRDGRVNFVLQALTTNGEVLKIGSGLVIGPASPWKNWPSTFYTYFSFGKSLNEVKKRGFVLPDGKMSITIEFEATEEFFCLEPLLDKTPVSSLGVSQMLYDDLTKNPEGEWNSLVDFAIISVDGRRFPCHRNVLAMSSDYFRDDIFGNEENVATESIKTKIVEFGKELEATNETHQNKMTLKLAKTETKLPFSGEIVQELLHWLYCGRQSANFDQLDVEELLVAADIILLDDLEPVCEKSLLMTTTADNALDRLHTARKVEMEFLENRAMALALMDPDVLGKADALGPDCYKEMSSLMHEAFRAPKTSWELDSHDPQNCRK